MTKCPNCGATLGEDATKCPCGWTKEKAAGAPAVAVKDPEVKIPQTVEEFQREYLAVAKRAEDQVKGFKDDLGKVTIKLDDLLDPEKDGSIPKLAGDVVQLNGQIERVRVNLPIYQNGLPVTEQRHWTNSWRHEFFDFLLHGPFLSIKKMKGLATTADVDEADAYYKAMQPVWEKQMLRNPVFLGKSHEWRQKYTAGAMGETVTGYGKEWIPPKFVNEIMMLATYESVIMREAGSRPLTVYKQQWPKGDYANFTFELPLAEGATPAAVGSESRLETSVFTLEAQRGVGLGLLGRRFIEDARLYGIAVVDVMVEAFKHKIAQTIDNQAFQGVVATPHLLDGLQVDSEVNDTNLTSGTLTYVGIGWEDWLAAPYKSKQRYRKGGKYWVPPKGFAALPQLKNSNGDPIFCAPREGHPAMLGGYPVVEVDEMSETEATTEPAFLFGNMKSGFVVAFLEQAKVDTTDQLYWAEGQIALKIELMMDMAISWPETWQRFLFLT